MGEKRRKNGEKFSAWFSQTQQTIFHFFATFYKAWRVLNIHTQRHTHARTHTCPLYRSLSHSHTFNCLSHSLSVFLLHTHTHTGKYNYRHTLQYADTSTDKPKYTNTHINALEWTHSFTFSILHTFAHTQFLSLRLFWSVRIHLSIKCF